MQLHQDANTTGACVCAISYMCWYSCHAVSIDDNHDLNDTHKRYSFMTCVELMNKCDHTCIQFGLLFIKLNSKFNLQRMNVECLKVGC